jgi:hypothetical protein
VVQLQVPFAMLLAVVTLQEEFTMLQAIGTGLMRIGSDRLRGVVGSGALTPGLSFISWPLISSEKV